MPIKVSNDLINLPLEEKIPLIYQVITETLSQCENPVVLFGGGVHSCVMLHFVKDVEPDIPILFSNYNFFAPELVKFVRELKKKENINLFEEQSELSMKEFVKLYGFPFFKSLRKIIPKKDFEKYRITDKCRYIRRKLEARFFKKHNTDAIFVGLICEEATAIRIANWKRFGYIHRRPDGILISKPIMHMRERDCIEVIEKFNIPFHKPLMSNYYGSNTCYFCGIGMFDEGPIEDNWRYPYEKKDGGNLGWFCRNRPELFNQVMYELGGAEVLKKIARDTMNTKLLKWVEEYIK